MAERRYARAATSPSPSVGVSEDLSRHHMTQSSDWGADEGGGEGEVLLNGGAYSGGGGQLWRLDPIRLVQIFWP